ncbi:hypothetical protein Fot_35261 [Forsythia ovata]|uniref:Uncharacterized protein n=1 Tax=Forsythia ovata TaxID=205694 RepID=A0ABD1SNS4_9LAMI
MPLYIFHTLFKLNECAKRDGEPKEGVKDWYYLTPREAHSPIITGHPSSIKHWTEPVVVGCRRLAVPTFEPSSNALPKIGLADLSAKKFFSVMRGKETNKSQKRTLASISPKASDQSSDALPNSDPK